MYRRASSGHTPTHLSIHSRGSHSWSYRTQRMLALVAIFLGLAMAFGAVAYGHIAPSLNPEPVAEEQTELAPREAIYDNEAASEAEEVVKTESTPVVEEANQAEPTPEAISTNSAETALSEPVLQAESSTATESMATEGTPITDSQVYLGEPCTKAEEIPTCWTQEPGDVVDANGVITKPDGTTIWPIGVVIHPNGVCHFIKDGLFGKEYDYEGVAHQWGIDIIFNDETGRYEPVQWEDWGPFPVERPVWHSHPEPYVGSDGEVHYPGTPDYHPELEGLWGFVPDSIKPEGWESGVPWPVPLDWSSIYGDLTAPEEPGYYNYADEVPEIAPVYLESATSVVDSETPESTSAVGNDAPEATFVDEIPEPTPIVEADELSEPTPVDKSEELPEVASTDGTEEFPNEHPEVMPFDKAEL